MPKPPMSTSDKDDLLRSMKHWQAELREAQVKLSALQRAEAQALKAKQLAQSRIERRRAQLGRIEAGPRRRTVNGALHYVGVTEKPSGSNRGPHIDEWQRRFHMQGQPWCGAFVGAMLEIHGGVNVSDRIVYTPYIWQDARSGLNGMEKLVDAKDTHSGDLVLFDFGSGGIKHVGMLVAPFRGGLAQTVEGNTAFGSAGSQDNGGAVARRSRSMDQIHSFVRPKYR